ncbi:MAG: sulfurtransferase complex subunit TusB [Methanomassiliicoccales archaeon]|nr:sulfurtransferase complex subunit TusB [Methanomassiliicoccales archaeon]
MAPVLFILLRSPGEYSSLDHIAAIGGDEASGAILFEDAVYFAVDRTKARELLEVTDKVYVIEDDLAARGFSAVPDGFQMIDYSTAIDLIMEQYDQTITV